MKQFFSLVVLSGLLLAKAIGIELDQAQHFTLCYEDQHFPPFILGTTSPKSGEPSGILVDYIQRAAQINGHEITLVRYPWLRCQQAVKSGQVDGLFAFIYSEERDTWAAFPKTSGKPDQRYTHLSRYPIFVAKDTQLTWDGTNLMPKNAVVQSLPGYIADAKLQAMDFMPIINMQPKEALPLIASGRLTGYVMDELIGWSLIMQLGLSEQITQLDIPFIEQPWYVAFSKQRYQQSGQSIEAFWSTMQVVREEYGEVIIRAYLGSLNISE